MPALNKETLGQISLSLENYRQKTATPGISLVVVKDGRVALTAASGLASIEASMPMTACTRFAAGSITKTVCALAFLLLEREGLLSLKDPVSAYFPEVAEVPSFALPQKQGMTRRLSLYNLLTHSSGIPELGFVVSQFFRLCGMEDQGPYAPADSEGLFAGLVKAVRERILPPESRFLYSNENFVLLAKIAEMATGEKFDEIVRRRILLPLGMTDSSIGLNADSDAPIALGYFSASGQTSPVPISIPQAAYGPGGLVTTTEDLGRYLSFLLGYGKTGEAGIKGFSSRMWKGFLPREGFTGLSYGLGWYIQDDEFDEPLVYHGGDVLFSGGIIALLPLRKIGIGIGQNTAGSPALGAFARDVLRLIINAEKGTNTTRTDKAMVESGPAVPAAIEAKALIGSYLSTGGAYRIEATFDRGVLVLRPRIPGSAESPELLFTFASGDRTIVTFKPAGYPPSSRQAGCEFIRDETSGKLWLRYDSYLLMRMDTVQ